MRNVLNPKWILIVNTLPVILLFMIYLGAYQIIKTLLPERSIELWLKFGATLAALSLLNVGYAAWLIRRKKNIHPLYGLAVLLVYITFLYVYGAYASEIIPASIPRWMMPGNIRLYVGTFLMPTLAMALYMLVIGWIAKDKIPSPGINFAIAIMIPVSWYVFIEAILPFWKSIEDGFNGHIIIIFIIIGTVLFLFFLSRGVYILSLKKSERWRAYQLFWKIIVAIVFPQLGLLVSYGSGGMGIGANAFGDFTNSWFFIIAGVNGLLVCLPNPVQPLYRLMLFVARSITFSYIVYFFLIFLPYLPISVFAIIAFGLGFLMLTPLILMLVQSKILLDDFDYLYRHYAKWSVLCLFSIGFAVLPLVITISYSQDKKALHAALDYVYEPDYAVVNNKPINIAALKRVLEAVSYHKNGRFGMIASEQLPFLSPYYNWLVLDNMTLSDAKINLLQKIFLGYKQHTSPVTIPLPSENVKITDVKVNSTYDTDQQAWKSWIDLEITNSDTVAWQSEYQTSFELPEGAWISDYYLWVNDVKKPGILAEKKTATWIYEQITSTRKDPGILYYLSGNKVGFKVFPFLAREKRKTGFEILHKEPIQLIIDSNVLPLEDTSTPALDKPFTSADGSMIYVPAQVKKQLPIVQRKPYFHFIIDGSIGKEKLVNQYVERIEALFNEHLLDAKNSRFTWSNAYTKTFDYAVDWQDELRKNDFKGGFYLERSIKEILLEHYNEKSKTYPVIVVVTEDFADAILPKDFADFKITFPESELFFELEKGGMLLAHSLVSEPKTLINNAQFEADRKVLAYPTAQSPIAYLTADNQPSIVLKSKENTDSQSNLKAKNWDAAFTLHGKWLMYQLHPENGDQAWLDLVKNSFATRIMTPVTSFIVVENEAQEAALKAKQAKALAAKPSLDLGEDTERMSEPSLLLMIGILLFLFFAIKFYKSKYLVIKL